MSAPKTTRMQSFVGNVLVILGYGGAWLAGGHAVAPIGLILMFGDWQHAPVRLGWAGIGSLVVAPLIPGRWIYLLANVAGLSCLLASWAIFVVPSDSFWFAFMMSIPFFAACIARIYVLKKELFASGRNEAAGEQSSHEM